MKTLREFLSLLRREGELVEVDDDLFRALPPIAAVLEEGAGERPDPRFSLAPPMPAPPSASSSGERASGGRAASLDVREGRFVGAATGELAGEEAARAIAALPGLYTLKYFACGWWTTIAEVDCSG